MVICAFTNINSWDWRVTSTGLSSRSPEFNYQQPHGDSQPTIMGSDFPFLSDALFFHSGIHANYIKYINK